ncbi:MAG: 30S ribosomal protein S1 [bacterium]|nr:30S ribosomal protein S1 [bacterium]
MSDDKRKVPGGFGDEAIFQDEFSYSTDERQELEQLYDKTFSNNEENSITTGTVVNITERDVAVDIGFKSEGWIPIDEFEDPTNLKIGDQVDVFIEKFEGVNGALQLSKKRADVERTWMRLKELETEGAVIEGKVVRRIKGGLVVDLMGIDAFLPGSQIDIHPVRDFDSLLGKKMDFRIVKINDVRKNIVVSRKVLIEEDMREIRDKVLTELEVGQIREGVVKNITNFGVFVDLGGVDGLLHITDLSWGRVNHPSDVVKLDQKITVKVLNFDRERNRISIGLKQLLEHPWNDVEARFPIETRVNGKVVSLTRYGAFVELAPGVEGLIHISEMSWTQHVKHPSQILSVGQEVEVMVLEVRKDERKISLGLKQTEANPWEALAEKYAVGSVHEGVIRDLVPFGVFVELEPGIEGLVHISDLSWTRKLRHPGEMVKKDDALRVQVLSFDRDERRIALGVKQLEENPWESFEGQYDVGSEVECEVAKVIDKGVVVTLPFGLEGFVPNSKLRPMEVDGSKVALKEGDTTVFKVIEYDRDNKKVILATPRQLSEEAKTVAEYKKTTRPAGGGAIADAFREAGFGGDDRDS